MKLRASEYCACIGFSDNKAIVSKQAARKYRGYDVARFLNEGLLRQAFSLACYHGDEAARREILQILETKTAGQILPRNVDDLKRLYGYIPVPQNLSGILYV